MNFNQKIKKKLLMDNSLLSEKSLRESKKFNNKEEEFEFYKKNYITLEKNLHKYETKIKTLENSNKKLQQFVNENARGGNNTSTQFFLPSEFKKLWENLTQTELLAPFDNFINNYIFICNICQDLTIITYNETKDIIEKKVDSLLICLGVKNNSNEKRLEIISKFIPFFQEHFLEIFKLNKDNIENIKNQLIKISNSYNFNFEKKDLEEAIKDKQFNILLEGLFGLCLHMLLHEPLLTFNIEKYEKRKIKYYYYDKKEFQCIEGFGNEKTPCLIILPPPLLRNSFPFNGMKAAVYLIENPSQDIIEQCNFYQREKDNKKKFNDIKKNGEKNNFIIDNNNNFNVNKEKVKIELFKSPITVLNENIKTIEIGKEINKDDKEKNKKKNLELDMNNIQDNNITEKENIIQSNSIINIDLISNDSDNDNNNKKEIRLKSQKLLDKEEEKNQQIQKIETPSNKKIYDYNIYEKVSTPKNKKIDPSYNNYIKNTNLLNTERVPKNNIFERPPLFKEDVKNKQTLTPNYKNDKIGYKYNLENKKNENTPVSHLYSKYPSQNFDEMNYNNYINTSMYSIPTFNFEKNKNIKKRVSNYSNNNSFSNTKFVNSYYQKDENLKGKSDYNYLFNTISHNYNINNQNLNDLYKKYSDYLSYDNMNYHSNYNSNTNDNYIASVREIYQKRYNNNNINNNNNNEMYKNNYLRNYNINNYNNNYNLNKIGIDYLKRKYNINSENENQNKFQSYSFNY